MEIAAEYARYCTKFCFPLGTTTYDQCIRNMEEFRLKVEKQVADENEF
jgi:hypothetical protein